MDDRLLPLNIHLFLPFEALLPEALRSSLNMSCLFGRIALQRPEKKRGDRVGCDFILAEMMVDRKPSALDEELIDLIMG